jgi:hypothetical protein
MRATFGASGVAVKCTQSVIPAKAGIQPVQRVGGWPREARSGGVARCQRKLAWIPAFAGMTEQSAMRSPHSECGEKRQRRDTCSRAFVVAMPLAHGGGVRAMSI